ncbi:GTP cyclohydrolase II [Sphingomonas sp.]|uniref:GTP cyclohydrolase II n=1 Tax=Sphingomonas sp. TaxID=28214 RepID=UPI003B00726B
MVSARLVARAIDACRRGWPVAVRGSGGTLTLLSVETADTLRLADFGGGSDILLSSERAAVLMLGNQRGAAGGGAVRIAHTPWLDFDTATALADPAQDLATPLKGPFRVASLAAQEAANAALKLARLAGLLPAFFVRDGGHDDDTPMPDAEEILSYDRPSRLSLVTRARLPIDATEKCEIVAFRSADEAVEHVALLIGEPNGQVPLVRLHSECLTGDVFGSLKCDCGPQLNNSLERIANSGWGIVLYLRQEGRGIGLVNKLRAYSLQDQGFDTVDANLRLGFNVDARDFSIAARILELLGQSRIRLLTNNPTKVRGLGDAGIEVVEQVSHVVTANPHNLAYLDTKRVRTGHLL